LFQVVQHICNYCGILPAIEEYLQVLKQIFNFFSTSQPIAAYLQTQFAVLDHPNDAVSILKTSNAVYGLSPAAFASISFNNFRPIDSQTDLIPNQFHKFSFERSQEKHKSCTINIKSQCSHIKAMSYT
jgi:hypothetical protein